MPRGKKKVEDAVKAIEEKAIATEVEVKKAARSTGRKAKAKVEEAVAQVAEKVDAAAAAAEAQASIAKVLPDGGEISEEIASDAEGVEGYYVQTSEEGAVTAYAVRSSTGGFGGLLTLMVGVLPDGTVYNTSVLAHSETPGLGAKCAEEKSAFREQWKGFAGVLSVKKDGGDVDAITASTITSRAYTLAVENALNTFKALSHE